MEGKLQIQLAIYPELYRDFQIANNALIMRLYVATILQKCQVG